MFTACLLVFCWSELLPGWRWRCSTRIDRSLLLRSYLTTSSFDLPANEDSSRSGKFAFRLELASSMERLLIRMCLGVCRSPPSNTTPSLPFPSGTHKLFAVCFSLSHARRSALLDPLTDCSREALLLARGRKRECRAVDFGVGVVSLILCRVVYLPNLACHLSFACVHFLCPCEHPLRIDNR